MPFPTVRFALYYCVVLPASWLLMPRPLRWRLFILGASLAFYSAWDVRYTALLLGSIVGNEVLALGIHRAEGRARSRRTALAVVLNLGALGWFKYVGWLSEQAGGGLERLGVDWAPPVPHVLLPVGISFFTFQALSYVLDVSRKKMAPVGLLDFAVYLSFFPHLVAGPIVRASEFLPQLRTRRNPREVDATTGLWLIAAGLLKKVVVASYLERAAVQPLFDFPGQHGGVEALIGIYAYAIQIYADFSGYTDIAIGIALLLGFRFPQNFDAPYSAASLQDFWRRWHMTLSRWLRDYLYIPLGGNRGGRRRTYVNLLLTMLLGGFWHGADWKFVIWGAIHGGGLALGRWRQERRDRRTEAAGAGGSHPAKAHAAAPGTGYGEVLVAAPVAEPIGAPADEPRPSAWRGRLFTFHVVCLAWVFFQADSVASAFDVLGRVFGGTSTAAVNPVVVLVIAGMLALQLVPAGVGRRARAAVATWSLPAQAAALAGVLVVVDALGPEGIPVFIYERF